MNYFLYRFIKDNEIIYIGKTKDLYQRLKIHFSGNGHLNHECYYDTDRIEYARLKTNTEMDILEIYYINKYSPKYNDASNYKEKNIPIDIKDIEWKNFDKFNFIKAKYDLMRKDMKDIDEAKKQLQALMEEVNCIKDKLEFVYKNINKIKGRSAIPLNEDEEKINNEVGDVLFIIKNSINDESYGIDILENTHYRVVYGKYFIDFISIWPMLEEYFKHYDKGLIDRKLFIKKLIRSKYICGSSSKEYYKVTRLAGETRKAYVCNLEDL